MRRTAILASLLVLPGCTGFGTFLDNTFSMPNRNPNMPMTDSQNVRRVLGTEPEADPLLPEPGNVWPTAIQNEPTLEDLIKNPAGETNTGEPVPANPPPTRQPRRGSSTAPGYVSPATPGQPGTSAQPALPDVTTPGNPIGTTVQTPSGPATDTGGTKNYRQLNTPAGPGAIIVPNGNGTSTVINPNGTVQVIPTPR